MNKQSSSIKAGAGKCRIDFPEDFFPYHGFNHRLLTGVHDELFVRAAMITNDTDGILFVSVDTGDLSDAWLSEISSISGLPEDNIFLTATHTHEAPYIDRTIPENVMDSEKTGPYIEEFRKALNTAVTAAKDSLTPARIGFGTGMCAANVNRDIQLPGGGYRTGVNPHGASDHAVYVLKAETLDNRPVFFINNYAVHSSVMLFTRVKEGGMLASGDLAGAAMNYVEEATGAISLFTMGAAGDQNPLFSAAHMTKNPDGSVTRSDEGMAGFALVRALGNLLGSEILFVSQHMSDMTDTASIAAACSYVTAPGQKKPDFPHGTVIPPDYEYEEGETRTLRLGMIRVNDLVFAGVPGEIMNSIGADIRCALLKKGFDRSVIMTQCNGSNSYMGDDTAYDLHKFAATASYVKKGISGILKNGFAAMADSLE